MLLQGERQNVLLHGQDVDVDSSALEHITYKHELGTATAGSYRLTSDSQRLPYSQFQEALTPLGHLASATFVLSHGCTGSAAQLKALSHVSVSVTDLAGAPVASYLSIVRCAA